MTGTTTEKEATRVVLRLLDLSGYPHPTDQLLPAFLHPSVISILVESLWEQLPPSSRIGRNARLLPDRFDPLRHGEAVEKGRILGPLGSYPNIAIDFGKVRYAPFHGIPLLISILEHDESEYTELGYLNELELVAAAAIMLSDKYPRFHFYFEPENEISFGKPALDKLSEQEQNSLFYELLSFRLRPDRPRVIFQPSTSALSPAAYAYPPFEFVTEAHEIFEACTITDQLLLRTLFFLQKGNMLWLNRVFSEDAVANVFFSLEGCLLLLQRKYGGSPSKIDLQLLTKLFKDHFERGEELFEFIKEAYDKRIEIVHPSPISGANWQPFLLADNYYEYFDIARELLNFVLIERRINRRA